MISVNFTTLTARTLMDIMFTLIGVGVDYFTKEETREMVARDSIVFGYIRKVVERKKLCGLKT